ncbi:phosphotransferase-like protein, putative [Bodo saltans]|uniref:Phosphotransferase-like protein, putative n=1 Tax=Bodo saltans TaxID=75058 RepID=A0A0S4JJA9_BODSA|nr:phosphotransferase-like protein, putative [Bodo saltans]|eukprot:CUG91557.1 phosphotransferase-like protein, putative [Bodo saltans]
MPLDVVLFFDYGGVLTSVAVPAARRLAAFHMKLVFEQASRSVSLVVPDPRSSAPGGAAVGTTISASSLAKRYSSVYFLVSTFTEKVVGTASSFKRLENGLIRRNAFITGFKEELKTLLAALVTPSTDSHAFAALKIRKPKDVEEYKKRHPHLCIPLVQQLMLQILDPESLLCVLEKLSWRKNVLNMLYYLRAVTHQEIKLGVITNNWEAEGHYVRTSTEIDQSGSPQFITLSCPIEYGHESGGASGSFDVNGLFDVVAQSYMLGKSKPSPDIYEIAIESGAGKYKASGSAKPLLFFFDDLKANCTAAEKNIPGEPFTKVYHIANGPSDVFRGVRDAIRIAAEADPTGWAHVLAGLDKDIAPLFQNRVLQPLPLSARAGVVPPDGTPVPIAHDAKPQAQELPPSGDAASQQQQQQAQQALPNQQGSVPQHSWILTEFHNLDDNLLCPPPPPNPTLEPIDDQKTSPNYLDLEERNRILHFLARTCPQYFVLPPVPSRFEDCGNLVEDGGFATSSGKIAFEMFKGGMSNPTYRFTCRTGSFVLRKQPRGKLLPGAHNMKREFDIIRHLEESTNLPVPKCLVYCNDRTVCAEDFYVMRYRDGKMVYRVGDLASAPFTRAFSQSRVLAKTTLNPRMFYREAVAALVDLHNAPIPPFLRAQQKQRSTHPILHLCSVWEKQYRRVVASVPATSPAAEKVKFRTFEFLTEALHLVFAHATADGPGSIPSPEKLRDFKIDNMMFSHRSLEGRTKYPPKIVLLLDFELAAIGDPLTDVAYLALFHLFPSPRGIINLPQNVQSRFPSAVEILEEYCRRSCYMTKLAASTRKRVFFIYMAAMCHKLAGIAHGVYARGLAGNATDVEAALKLSLAVDHLSLQGCKLLGVEPPESKL